MDEYDRYVDECEADGIDPLDYDDDDWRDTREQDIPRRQ